MDNIKNIRLNYQYGQCLMDIGNEPVRKVVTNVEFKLVAEMDWNQYSRLVGIFGDGVECWYMVNSNLPRLKIPIIRDLTEEERFQYDTAANHAFSTEFIEGLQNYIRTNIIQINDDLHSTYVRSYGNIVFSPNGEFICDVPNNFGDK